MQSDRRKRANRPSSKDVAVLAGVSQARVSVYVSEKRHVSDELSERTEVAIRQLDDVPDTYTRALKEHDAKTSGLMVPALSRFFTPMMQAIG